MLALSGYTYNGSNLSVTDEMRADFDQDGYILVKYVITSCFQVCYNKMLSSMLKHDAAKYVITRCCQVCYNKMLPSML